MSPDSALMLAIATGAAARMYPNYFASQRPAVDAYLELVRAIEQAYPQVDARMLEIASGSLERQELLARQLRESGAAGDARIRDLGRRVLQTVLQQHPRAIVAVFADENSVSEALLTLNHSMEENQNGRNQHPGHPSPAANSAAPAHLPAL
ncbi:MAG: hypothetical protein GX579_01805 [Chloroflexi bacterium]|nr:hypothetical protein [Chloroflexota bacterium]